LFLLILSKLVSISIYMSNGMLFNMDMRVAADLIRDLDLIWHADSPWDLARVLDWLLVALPVLLGMALRSSGISRLSLSVSITLAISVSSMSVGHNLGVMTNNSRAVVDLLRSFFAMGGDDVFAFLNISGVNDDVIFLMTLLTLVLDWFLVTLLMGLAEALKVVVVVLSISGLSFSLSFTLMVSAVSMRNNLRIMTNNS